MSKKFPWKVIGLTMLIAGTIDISLALLNSYLQRGTTPNIVFRYIASGVFGKEAFSGGVGMAVSGLLFHYLITFNFCVIFFLLYHNRIIPGGHKILTGIITGILVWGIMQYIVVPLSGVPGKQSGDITNIFLSIVILIIAIGLPFSFMANSYYRA
jgi:hypothetical protein